MLHHLLSRLRGDRVPISTSLSKQLGVAAVGAYRKAAATQAVSAWKVWADEGDHYVVAVFPTSARTAASATFVAVEKQNQAATVIDDQTRYRGGA